MFLANVKFDHTAKIILDAAANQELAAHLIPD